MLEAIRDVHDETGRGVGMKPAGGIRTSKQAIQNLVIVDETLGPDWLTPDRFRLGASSLLNDVLMQIRRRGPAATRTRSTSRVTEARPSAASSTPPRPIARDRPARRRYGLSSAASGDEPPSTTDDHPGERGGSPRSGRRARRTSAPPWPPRATLRERLVRPAAGRAREVPVPDRAAAAGARARVRGARVAQRRQADQGVARRRPPLAAAHFFYYAGWADKLEYAFPTGGRGRSASRARSSRGTSRC